MKLSKTIIGLVILMVSMAMVTAIPQNPLPVDGKLTGDYVSGLEVKVTNIRSGLSMTTQTIATGEYLVDWANSDMPVNQIKYQYGDQFKIEVTACASNSACSKTVTYTTQPEIFSTFELAGVLSPQPVIPGPVIPTVDDKVASNPDRSSASLDAYYGDTFIMDIGQNKLAKLQDGVITFNGEDYDVHETVRATGKILTGIDNNDYGVDPYLIFLQGDIEYKYIFDDKILLNDITEDEDLKIVLLGEPAKIIKATGDSITIITGEKHDVKVGDTLTYAGLPLNIVMVEDGYIFVSYNGDSKKISEGDVETVGGMEVYAQEVMSSDKVGIISIATIRIGTNIKETVKDGDDYYKSDVWSWQIKLGQDPQYIGIVNQQDYTDIDNDYKPLKVNDKISLPNDFTQIVFNGVTAPKMTEIRFRIKDAYLEATGDDNAFQVNSKDYNKVFLDAAGIYDSDKIKISSDKVRIGDSDTDLKLGSAIIRLLKIELDMSNILYDGVSFSNKDDTLLDHFGIIFKDPESGVTNKKGFSVRVPEERPEATIIIGQAQPVIPGVCPSQPVSTCPSCPAAGSCPQVEIPSCPATGACPVVQPPVCPVKECAACPDCPTTDNGGIFGYIIAIILAIGGGVQIYKNNKGGTTILHKHKGVIGYHDVNILHKNKLYQHARFKENPAKFLKDVENINTKGSV